MERSGRSGYSLIEVMIGIAILAILAAVPVSFQGTVGWLNQEDDYRFALRNARHELQVLRQLPYGEVPPRVMTVPASGLIHWEQGGLIPGSVNVHTVNGEDVAHRVDQEGGRARIALGTALAGRKVVVDFAFVAPDAPEALTVSSHPCRVSLRNAPVTRLVSVHRLRGERAEPLDLSAVTLDDASGLLSLPPRTAGTAVVVEYVGSRVTNEVHGCFLDGELRPTRGAGTFKLLRLDERYGDRKVRLHLSLLRAPR